MKYYVDPYILNTVRVFPDEGRYDAYRYDMNENPEGLPKDFVDGVLKEITPEFLAIYPEPSRFIEKYAKFIGVKSENVLTTNGSDMAIRYLLETFGEQGKDVVTVSPSFEMYMVNCSILGLNHKPVSYEPDLTLNTDKIVDAINNDTRIVVLVNPNNPVGNVYSESDFTKIVEKAKSVGAIVIVDEAYHYFYNGTFLSRALKEENVIILRTFSKLFSIAACRIGVVISNPTLIEYVRRARLTFDVNSIALLFAERLIERPDIMEKLIKSEAEGKRYFAEDLKAHGYECMVGNGNFVFIKTKDNPVDVAKRLKDEKNVLVHAYKNALLKGYIRVSVGSVAAMKIFLEAFYQVDGQ